MRYFTRITPGIICIALLLVNMSCRKYLDNELQNAAYENTFWKTEQDVQGAISGAYAYFRRKIMAENAFFVWGDLPTRTLMKAHEWNKVPIAEKGDFTAPYMERSLHDWTQFYCSIAICNLAIKKIPQIEADQFKGDDPVLEKNKLLGEAYFLRALNYFYMLRIWGGVPIENDAVSFAEDIKVHARATEAEVLQQIYSDAKLASSLMTWEMATQYNRARASKGAALALLAHAYAWENDYENALVFADSLINENHGIYQLEDANNLKNIFQATGSPENIFVLTTLNSNNEASFDGSIGFVTLEDPYLRGYFAVPQYTFNKDNIAIYYPDANDARRVEFIGLPSNAEPILIKYANVKYRNPVEFLEPFNESNIVIFRLADIILLKAEALAALGRDNDALTAMNIIRSRAGIGDYSGSGQLLQREILHERMRELVGEGQNYFDMVRTKNYPTWMTPDRLAQQGWLWPIHTSFFANNSLLEQNEYWKGKYSSLN